MPIKWSWRLLKDKAKVDLNYMQKLCGIDTDKMIKSLEGIIFRVPEYGEANNRKETAIATSKQDSIKEAFFNWI